ncbi:hypothetical protein NQ317_003303 [Molorchus minor]|uniref:Nose resistant-to-fluoxetine protein N-terminal domain-containing protein n=1 Tax=Molorchus minor TaxID=1323400 RepID=A0ABQ9IZM4_9CUCU|nr:hypothetical protein NQ317_003303 [Molorchus minor]
MDAVVKIFVTMKLVMVVLAYFVKASLGQFSNGVLITPFESIFDNLNISNECNSSLGLYFESLLSGGEDPWALKMLDATSKIPVGLSTSYNFAELGDFTGCLATESNDGLVKAKYCVGTVNLKTNSSDFVILQKDLDSLHRQNQLRKTSIRFTNLPEDLNLPLTWAICLPSNCTDQDVLEMLNLLIGSESALCQTTENLSPVLTKQAIVTIVILSLFVIFIVASTFIKKVPLSAALVAFSAYSNGQKLFKVNNNSTELSCLNGIRVLSMVWVVVGHSFSVKIAAFPIFNYKDVVDWVDSPFSMTFVSGTLSVDTFLVVGGTLVVYVFMKATSNGKKFNIAQYYLHRYLRLTPPLAAAVLVSATLLEYLGSGPHWSYVKIGFQDNCVNYWWSTLLYIQNYVNVTNFCVGQTWYLNIDMQLYILSPLILFLLVKYPKLAFCVLGAFITATIGTSFYIAYDRKLSGVITNIYTRASVDEYMNNFYLKTHTRAAPWLMGIFLGYVLAKMQFQENKNILPKFNKKLLIVLWTICIVGLLSCVYGGHSTLRGPDYDRLGNAFYIALLRPAWSLCVMWIIFACVTGYGGPVNWFLSFPIYQVLNRFTYSIYILHVTVLYIMGYASKRGVYFSTYLAIYSFWGIYMLMYCLSLFWILAFESPVIVLEKFIFKRSRN